MKTVAISVPDEVFEEASREAERLHRSVSEVLASRLTAETFAAAAHELRIRKQEELFNTVRNFSAENQLSREEVHDRSLLR